MLKDLESRGVSQKSEGAVVIMCDAEQGTELPPLLLVKSDGGYLYGTTDLATLRERVRGLKAQRLIYVADKRQSLHFRQVFQGAKKSGYVGDARVEHVGFGTVNGRDGKPFKTRDGGVMRLQSLLAMALEEASKRMDENEIAKDLSGPERQAIAKKVAYAAVKYADLSNHRSSDYAFDIEKFTRFEGKTGPYLLYASVRMKSILRKAAERGQKAGALLPPTDAERPLFLKLAVMPEALLKAAEESLPHLLCEYAFELSGAFSTFYSSCNIINEADGGKRGSWLRLTEITLQALETVLGILGMETPEQM
jgi:arginyl-tRNA synthetase